MKVYWGNASDDADSFVTASNSNREAGIGAVKQLARASTLADVWVPLHGEIVRIPPAPSDFVGWFAETLLMRPRAAEVVARIVGVAGELLPAHGGFERLWLLNCLVEVDALDAEQTEFAYLPSGNFSHMPKMVFKPEVVDGLTIFKLSEPRRGDLYMTDLFVDAVRAAGLTGFGPKLEWDSEAAEG